LLKLKTATLLHHSLIVLMQCKTAADLLTLKIYCNRSVVWRYHTEEMNVNGFFSISDSFLLFLTEARQPLTTGIYREFFYQGGLKLRKPKIDGIYLQACIHTHTHLHVTVAHGSFASQISLFDVVE